MKKLNLGLFVKINELYMACLCSGILLLISTYQSLKWQPLLLFVLCLLTQLLFSRIREKAVYLQALTGAAVFHLLAYYCLNRLLEDPRKLLGLFFFESLLLLSSLLCFACRRSIFLKGLLLFSVLFSLVCFSILYVEPPRIAVFLILLCSLGFLAEWAEFMIYKTNIKNTFYLFPFLLAASLLLVFVPVKETPMQWKSIKAVLRFAEEKYHALLVSADYFLSGSADSFSLSSSGFSSDSSLGEVLFPNNSTQLTVNGHQTHSTLYLTGSIYNQYTGSGWEKTSIRKAEGEKEYLLQKTELEAALARSIYSAEEIQSFINPCTFIVTYKGLKTKSLFYAPYTSAILFEKQPKMDDTLDTLMLTSPKGVGFSYRFLCWEVNYHDPRVEKLLKGEAFSSPAPADLQGERRKALIHQQYTALPEELPERVKDLAAEITKDASSDYEKLKAIESFLHAYTYTVTPSAYRPGTDFVDEFLFEQKSGYCSHFATAMAVLARCEGIPSRYVEGFVVPASVRYENRPLIVSGNQGHAWAEAYIDDIGWVCFEPTTDFYEAARTSWPQALSGDAAQNIPSLPPLSEAVPPAPEPEPSETAAFSLPGETIRMGLIVLGYLLLCLLFLIFLLLVRHLLRQNRYKKMDTPQKTVALMTNYFVLAKLQGFVPGAGETLSSFATRCKDCMDTAEVSFGLICDVYQAFRFGGQKISPEQLALLESYTENVTKQYLKSCGMIRRMLHFMR